MKLSKTKTNAPDSVLSHGANVDQPSPKVCSLRRIDPFILLVNGPGELRFGTNELRSESWKAKMEKTFGRYSSAETRFTLRSGVQRRLPYRAA